MINSVTSSFHLPATAFRPAAAPVAARTAYAADHLQFAPLTEPPGIPADTGTVKASWKDYARSSAMFVAPLALGAGIGAAVAGGTGALIGLGIGVALWGIVGLGIYGNARGWW